MARVGVVGRDGGEPHRGHPDVVHEADAEPHGEAGRPDPRWPGRRRRGAHGGEADGGRGDGEQQGQDRLADVVAHLDAEFVGQHRDEVHRPDRGARRRGGAGEPPASGDPRIGPHAAAQQVERGPRAQDGDQDRQRDEDRIVRAMETVHRWDHSGSVVDWRATTAVACIRRPGNGTGCGAPPRSTSMWRWMPTGRPKRCWVKVCGPGGGARRDRGAAAPHSLSGPGRRHRWPLGAERAADPAAVGG
jgi:hypothetical protein